MIIQRNLIFHQFKYSPNFQLILFFYSHYFMNHHGAPGSHRESYHHRRLSQEKRSRAIADSFHWSRRPFISYEKLVVKNIQYSPGGI